MNTKRKCILFLLIGYATIPALYADVQSDAKSVSKNMELGYKESFARALQLATTFPAESLLSINLTQWERAHWEVSYFKFLYAADDKDLIRPWDIINKEHNAIMTAIKDWQKVLKATPINNALVFMAKQDAKNITKSVANIDAARRTLNKTIFVRTNKKETAKIMMSFANLATRIGDFVVKCLNNLKIAKTIPKVEEEIIPAVPSRIPEDPDYIPDVPGYIPQPPVRK